MTIMVLCSEDNWCERSGGGVFACCSGMFRHIALSSLPRRETGSKEDVLLAGRNFMLSRTRWTAPGPS